VGGGVEGHGGAVGWVANCGKRGVGGGGRLDRGVKDGGIPGVIPREWGMAAQLEGAGGGRRGDFPGG
jgi:hypothetical protein